MRGIFDSSTRHAPRPTSSRATSPRIRRHAGFRLRSRPLALTALCVLIVSPVFLVAGCTDSSPGSKSGSGSAAVSGSTTTLQETEDPTGHGRASAEGRVFPSKILLLAVDGLEWNLVLDMFRDSELPNLRRLINEGTGGRIRTLNSPVSPAIWTTVATGVLPADHGITGFIKPRGKRTADQPALYTNADRRVAALWNILGAHNRRTCTVGWWMTYPVEAVDGLMVAQVNTSRRVAGVWKGSLIPGLAGQVHPPERSEAILRHAADVESEFDTLATQIFGRVPTKTASLAGAMWEDSRWSVRADLIYQRITEELLPTEECDLFSVYFGATDVLAHRFWRHTYPEQFAYPPSPDELEKHGDLVRNYYRHMDTMLGRLRDAGPPNMTIMVVSDHGMDAVNVSRKFGLSGAQKGADVVQLSGGHQKRPHGLLAAAGPGILYEPGGVDPTSAASRMVVPVLGAMEDITPTILTLLDIPVGRDMKGQALTTVIDPNLLRNRPVRFVETHTGDRWEVERQLAAPDHADARERVGQLRALGYIE